MGHFEQLQQSFMKTVPVGARVWILCDDDKYRLWSIQGGYKIKAKQRVYVEDPNSDSSFPANLIPSDPPEYTEYSFPRELAEEELAVPPKFFPDAESGRNGEAAFSVTTVVPANPDAGIPQELTNTCYYFGYEPGETSPPGGAGAFQIPYNQFVTDSGSIIQQDSSCEKLVMMLMESPA
tara:strand:+ start:3292 stop:3828 length:537 start_codon:yes stop_codon:yes gene_type:complete